MAIEEVKARVAVERGKLQAAANTIIGARATMAVLAIFVIGFASHLLYAPTRLPPISGLSLAQVGLPPVDLGEAGKLAREARESAERENVAGSVNTFVSENRDLVPMFNAFGFGACLILLMWNIWINARDRRYRSRATWGGNAPPA